MLEETARSATPDLLSARTRQPSDSRDVLRARFDHCSTDREKIAQLSALRRQQVCHRNPAALYRASEELCVDAVRLATMMTETDLAGPRRVDQHDLVPPLRQGVVHLSDPLE